MVATMVSQEGYPFTFPSGSTTKVLTLAEVDWMRDRCERYFSDNHFSNISDVGDVERLIRLELLCERYSDYLNRGGMDHFDKAVDMPELRRSITSMSHEIRLLKHNIGIDRKARDAERGEGSFPVYLERLEQRADAFGIHRDAQNAKIMELGMQLIALATYHRNVPDESEQRELGITLQDLYRWVIDVFTPEFMILDEHFRQNQKMWIAEM